ncbi:six-hairpin glycosidase [Xylaria castorea]|nr:six-hairpin glycosidase [Xylaria castorea]
MTYSTKIALFGFIISYGRRALAGLDQAALAKTYFGNDAPWYQDRIPFFEVSDTAIMDVYYYRWQVFRAHQRDLGAEGYISTEFIDDVSWQTQPSASINSATGFHLNEGRWCRDRRFRVDYTNFMYGPDANPRHYSDSTTLSAWNAYLVDGVQSDVTGLLDSMQTLYSHWQDTQYDASKGLFYVEPISDATEYTIASIDASCGKDGFTGGTAFRPSINTYQYGNARAIANIAELVGKGDVAADYNARAAAIKENVQNSLWNSTFEHFIDRYYASTQCSTYWNFIRGRELVGYVPWLHDLPDDNAVYAPAWAHLIDPEKLGGMYGMRTNEPSYEYYMRQYRYEGTARECQWNGPAWPYQTAQVLGALANVLDHYPKTAAKNTITAQDYMNLLTQYAKLHYNKNRGGLNIEEDYDSATGAPIVGLDRSSHYFHSSFADLVITGLVGIRPRADDVLDINPLAVGVKYFRIEGLIYHGNEISVQWDADGSRYGTKGLVVEVGGNVAGTTETLERVTVNITRRAPPQYLRYIAKSIQLENSTVDPQIPRYPVGSVSVANAVPYQVQHAIDGRIWFFPQPNNTGTISHGWLTPAGNGSEVWHMVDFGTKTNLTSAEIAFYADGAVGAPTDYRVEANSTDGWHVVSKAKFPRLVENGITYASWATVSTSQIRLVFTPPHGLPARLVEWKLYSELVDGSVFEK